MLQGSLCFVFLGDRGSGKTELVKTMVEYFVSTCSSGTQLAPHLAPFSPAPCRVILILSAFLTTSVFASVALLVCCVP